MEREIQDSGGLREELRILGEIRRNWLRQSEALERGDAGLLASLLAEGQGYLDELARGGQRENLSGEADSGKEEDDSKAREEILSLLREIIALSRAVSEKASRQKMLAAESLRRLQLNKKALREGYLKKVPQSYGYFIDKKIGR
ncbi:cholesterol 24-hydroxylase [Syntrophobotulus glycolicus DSM 8271]|uniref:Cholesterol 24-hydroxylase n=1 Tax=Syntrophobotulus glycolicus (strain DSM 8271 / FlGlyR) TaxID=645991 RepID=F0SU35_SYNGF|nr:hypothetical protein [Syntrophobotulus glycolicus]ADY55418.1 cholesterol 24-hydroxylase [Syntrophobotulus glycolicus DSM 8271]